MEKSFIPVSFIPVSTALNLWLGLLGTSILKPLCFYPGPPRTGEGTEYSSLD